MPTTPQFAEAYRRLNAAQKEAVDTIDGPVMVIAGPGTGKTQVLTLRIANILLKTDTAPENILALTFTEAGVIAMRKRLAALIGAGAYRVTIATFHSFCNDIIARYPDRFPRIIGGVPITDAEQLSLVQEILDTGTWVRLRPYGDPSYYVSKIIHAVQGLKRDGWTPEMLTDAVAREAADLAAIPDRIYESGPHKGKMKGKYKEIAEDNEKATELARAYTLYTEALARRHQYDFEDMILEVVARLRADPDFLLILQEEYQYLLADEHQDTNDAQNALLELLASFHENPNLFIVGDEKQAIYRFQGASLANFLYFKDRYPGVRVISLSENYRSTQTILDSAHGLMEKAAGDAALRTPLKASALGQGEQLRVLPFSSADYERRFVAQEVRSLLDTGVSPDEIAVFYRNNADADPFVSLFSREGIPFVVLSEQFLLEDEDVRRLLSLLRVASAIGDSGLLAKAILSDPDGISPLDAFRLIRGAQERRIPLADLLASRALVDEVGVTDASRVEERFALYSLWARRAATENLLEVMARVFRESGLLGHILAGSGSLARMERIDRFLNIAKRLLESNHRALLVDFLVHLDTLEAHNVQLRSTSSAVHGGVRLMTAHKSKGLEFDHVFITGAYDGHWGGKKDRVSFRMTLVETPLGGKSADDDDERRLFFVALTRARHAATITYPTKRDDGRDLLPTRYLSDIDPKHCVVIATDDLEASFAARPEDGYKEARDRGPKITEREYLRALFLERGFSVTALNNYLTCPWQFFFSNLVRIEEGYTKFQVYGTAVHAALQAFSTRWKEEGEDPGDAFLLASFESHLARSPLSVRDFDELVVKGRTSLAGYHSAWAPTWRAHAEMEFSVRGVPFPVSDGEKEETILLVGKLDRMEFCDDDTVLVVDHKTSEPKSRNEIEGKTKSSDGSYKRQLVFYKLLLDAYHDGKYRMRDGAIDFTEPDEKGKYHREVFAITDEDVTALREEMTRVLGEILRFDFWDRRCDRPDCSYCVTRSLLDEAA